MSAGGVVREAAWSHPSQIPFVRDDPEAAALADERRALTTGELADAVERLAGGLAGLGLSEGDVIATMLLNRLEVVLVLLAAWRLGAALTPVNPALTADEAVYQLDDAGVSLVVADENTRPCVEAANARTIGVEELDGLSGEAPATTAVDEAMALLVYTSGTTGRPKGVILDHDNVSAMLGMLHKHFGIGPEDRALVVLPLFHVNAIMLSVLAPLAFGGSAVLLAKFRKGSFWEEVERHRPTYFSLVPAMYLMFNAMDDDVAPDTSSLRFCVCGAAPMPAAALEQFHDRFGVPIVEGYGLSETTVATTINPLDGERKPGSVGPALPGCEVAIAGEDGEGFRPAGEPGEVLVKGPHVMRGYLNKEEETAKTLVDGWLHTGDVGYLDEDGYLFLVDRTKDMIIRGGENIYPTEIEHALVGHDAVLEAAVIGREDDVMGEEVVAYVAFSDGQDASPDELLEFLGQRLARYKQPREIHVLPELPRNAVGKLDKPALRERNKG